MSSTSLYGNVSNVTVSSKNLTTLYNATPGNTVVANVPDRNFTTLYAAANATNILPTRAYGNSNVEAFLNVGTDGANTVQNINMAGTLTVGGQSNLGPVGNVHIDGGQLNYVLATDGGGGLFWTQQSSLTTSIVPYIHFDVVSTGNNQQFTAANIINYASNVEMNVMRNGVNIEPDFYEKVGNTTIQINIPLYSGDTIDILATGAGGNGEPAGNVYEVQFNGSNVFEANTNFTYTPYDDTLHVGNITLTSTVTSDNIIANTITANIHANLGNVGNVFINGGSNGQFLTTDGLGNLSWANVATGTPTSLNANIGNVIISGGSNGQVLTTYGNGTLHWTTVSGGGGGNTNAVGGTNAIQFANGTSFDGTQQFTFDISLGTFYNTPHLTFTCDTDPNVGSPDFSYITFNRDSIVGGGYGAIRAGYLDSITINAERHTSNEGFLFQGQNSTVTPVYFNVAGDVSFNEAWWTGFAPANVRLGNVNYLKISGGSSGQVLQTDGSNNLSWTSSVPTVTTNAQPNITSLGNLSSLNIVGMTSIQEAKELVTLNGTGATGTVNFDVLTSAIILQTANATANFTLNVRGNSTQTLSSQMSVGNSMSVTYVNKNGGTGYYANVIQIDGSTVTPVWPNGNAISTGTTNGYDVYNLNIIKTSVTPTYVTFVTVGSYS